jgi:hypothetical protein
VKSHKRGVGATGCAGEGMRVGGTAGCGLMSLESHRVLSSVGVKSSWLPPAMAYDSIAVVTERTSMAPHLTCAWLGTARRGGVSRAREVHTLRAPVILQPGQESTK